VNEFYERISREAIKITSSYEIIFVDDGSPDDSLEKSIALQKNDSRIKVIELAKNYGHHKAIMTGLAEASGKYIFLIDSDLEEDPEYMELFWNTLHEKDMDVVYGVQENRKGNWLERWSGKIFYMAFDFLSDLKLPKNLLTIRLMRKKAKESIIAYHERELCLGCIFADIGFRQHAITINKHNSSPTTYSFRRKISLFFNSIIAFSNKPLKIVFLTGTIVTVISFFYVIATLFRKIFYNIEISGWASVIVSIWFLGGITIMSIGILGLYMSKIFIETKQRPYTLIRKIYSKNEGALNE